MKQIYFKIAKKTFLSLFLGMGLFLGSEGMQAQITSAQSGNWTDNATWVGGVVPVAADYVIIAAGHNLTFTLGAATTVGALNIQNSASLIVSGNFTFTIGSVSPFSNIAGSLTISGTSSRTFGNLTVASTGSISSTGGSTSIASTTTLPWVNNGTIIITTLGLATGKTIENNGTFSVLSGVGSTSGGVLNNNASATLSLVGSISGTINNFGIMNSSSLSGTSAVANITNKASGVLNFTGASMTSTTLVLTATEAGNTVNYSGGPSSQTVKDVVYSNIILSNSGNKTIIASSGTLCTGTLTILDAAKANTSNTNVAVSTLFFGGEGKVANTYGSLSSSANVKDSTYFQGTGMFNVQNTLGVAEFSVNDLKLYPNPSVGGSFTISLPSMQDESTVSILNVGGATIYTTKVAVGENAEINPNKALSAGVYFVKMEQGGQSITKKLIVN